MEKVLKVEGDKRIEVSAGTLRPGDRFCIYGNEKQTMVATGVPYRNRDGDWTVPMAEAVTRPGILLG